MKTLKLFNAVLAKSNNSKPFISEQGFIIEPGALWAKEEIINFFTSQQLSGNDLNKTFHKSWKKIKDSDRSELLIEQIMHYISTYGSDFQDEIYIPDEVLNVPELKIKFKVIKSYSEKELLDKSFMILNSGIALKEETINDLLEVMVDQLDYSFTGSEKIRNKEAVVKIADLYGVTPADTMEFFRLMIYRSTGESLLIKSDEMIEKIKSSNFNPGPQLKKHGLEKLAEIFNRHKPLFLAFKKKCPKTINKISKLSKTHHKPLPQNPLNRATSEVLSDKDLHWLKNATPYFLFKVLSVLYARMNGQNNFVYRIRNGKSWTKEGKTHWVNEKNFDFVIAFIKDHFDLSGKTIFIPEFIKYALPTSEKMFIGNIPTGTRFYGKKMAVGLYWENDWGAHDLDLSGLNIAGKIGWNSDYSQDGQLLYSGDLTSAPSGAVEYLYANNGLKHPTLVKNSVYSGDPQCGYKIIIGKGDKMSRNYMMDPNNLMFEVKCNSVQRDTILGMFIPKKNKQCFVLLNFGAGQSRVSGNSELTTIATQALYQQWEKPFSLNKLIKLLGGQIVEDPEGADHDLSVANLQKDSFIKIFER